MNCAYHPDREVQAVCSTCGRPICEECAVNLNGQIHCKACLATRMSRPARETSGFLRFGLSLVPGLGHLYMGLFNRGLQLMVGFFLAIAVPNLLGIDPVIGFFVPVLIFFSVFDAREIHLRMSQGLEVEDKGFIDTKTWRFDWNSRYLGYGLVVIGILALYHTFVRDILWFFFQSDMYYRAVSAFQGAILGLLAIGVGLWMLGWHFRKS